MRGSHVLPLHDLDTAGKAFDAELTEPFLRAQLEETEVSVKSPGRVVLRFSRTGTDVIVHGRLSGSFSVPCARCLAPADFPVDAELSLLLVPSASERSAHAKGRAGKHRDKKKDLEEEETDVTDADLDTYEGEELVLDPFLREAILLEVPPFPLCSTDCPGIAPPPARSDEGSGDIDPRLAPLLRFKKQPSLRVKALRKGYRRGRP